MKITIKKDFRKLKQGDVYDFSIVNEIGIICIVGENGCGKSSLFHALRGLKNDLPTESMFENDFKQLKDNIEVEHQYDNIFYFDNVKDNGSNYMVAYDASNFLASGGYQTKDKSHGESSLIYISIFLEKLEKKMSNVTGKSLVVFDEVDNGFSIKNMSRYVNITYNLKRKHNCDVIVITHNPFFMYHSYLVYDFEKQDIETSENYIKNQTGFKLSTREDDIPNDKK